MVFHGFEAGEHEGILNIRIWVRSRREVHADTDHPGGKCVESDRFWKSKPSTEGHDRASLPNRQPSLERGRAIAGWHLAVPTREGSFSARQRSVPERCNLRGQCRDRKAQRAWRRAG